MLRKALLLAGVAAVSLCTAASGAQADNGLVAMDVGALNPLYGKINPFYGKINPFYGKINPFYGKISPFWGNIQPFWGKIQPFYGKINPFTGSDAFWGTTSAFGSNSFLAASGTYWQSAGPQWGDLNTLWDGLQSANATDYSGLQTALNTFFASAASTWSAQVQNGAPGAPPPPGGKGKPAPGSSYDFMSSFVAPLLAEYNIDPNDPNSLANASAQQRSAFFLDFYDNLMNYTGTDHVDWWMAAVHWSPMLAQIQGSAKNAAVGILDAYTTSQFADVTKLDFAGGYKNNVLDHGAEVASLIAAKQDGTGVMGVAPNATIQVLYNPFDASATASWDDVAKGIAALFKKNATVINASLGVPGSVLTSEWSEILNSPALNSTKHELVLVKAAGNEGVMQTADVAWSGPAPTNLVLVGSVDPNGNISTFSNTPGEACIVSDGGACNEQDKLKYRFVVAPGENLLVADNHGGTTRVSGTSFAAPLVTGTIALLQDRWPWLQQHADETVQIVLQSATDLGAPGVDPIYGWGELNIEASQSPLNWDNLVVYQNTTGGTSGDVNLDPKKSSYGTALTPASLKASVLVPGQLALWQNQGAYLVAFENIGSTYRDFQIPLSSLIADNNANIGAGKNPFESYLYQRMIDWANGTSSFAFNSQNVGIESGDWKMAITGTEATSEELTHSTQPMHSEFALANDGLGLSLKVGEGSGAHALNSSSAFALRSDIDPSTGGVNPILGFASGGAYAQGRIAVASGLNITMGVTRKSDDHIFIDPTFGPMKIAPLAAYQARATVMGVDYDLFGVTLNASYTDLNEADGVLGAQGGGALDLGQGKTGAVTVGASANLGGWLLSGSATKARTKSASDGFLTIDGGAINSTAYELAATKDGVFEKADHLRFSFTQPLHVQQGTIVYQGLEVVNRDDGTVGTVTQKWNFGQAAEYRMESSYGTSIFGGAGDAEAFAVLDLNAPDQHGTQTTSAFAGARMKLKL